MNVYSDGSDGGTGFYQCVELVNRLITTLAWSPTIWGNANQLYGDASTAYFDKHPNGSGYKPVMGDIVVWGGGYGGYGHVAVVEADSGSLLTVVEQNASPSGYDTYTISSSGYIAPRNGYDVEGFLHAKSDNFGASPTAPTPTPPTPAPTQTTGTHSSPATYAETAGGATHTWTDYSDAGGTEGTSITANATVQVTCRVQGFQVADGNTWWYQIGSSPWNDAYYASADAFYNDGQTSGSLIGTPFYDPNVPTCNGTKSPPPVTSPTTTTTTTTTTTIPAPTTYAETVGGVTHTWTDYSNAGGTEGPSIQPSETVQVTCRVQGFQVADGNTWWYQIASSPWNDAYYASADAFYNNGETSGPLTGTPFYDPNVRVC